MCIMAYCIGNATCTPSPSHVLPWFSPFVRLAAKVGIRAAQPIQSANSFQLMLQMD
jgi:hypothetical protein